MLFLAVVDCYSGSISLQPHFGTVQSFFWYCKHSFIQRNNSWSHGLLAAASYLPLCRVVRGLCKTLPQYCTSALIWSSGIRTIIFPLLSTVIKQAPSWNIRSHPEPRKDSAPRTHSRDNRQQTTWPPQYLKRCGLRDFTL
jgi:hypothetical protein